MTEPTERDRRRDFSSNRRGQFRHRFERPSVDEFARRDRRSFCKLRHDRLQLRLSDERNRLIRIDPLSHALPGFGPRSALPLDQQREDLDLAVGFSAVLIRRLFISEIADRPCADLPPHAGFLEGLARSRFRRRQPLDRPTLRNNPPPRLSSRNDEDFKRGHLREPIRQRAILDADCRPCPSFLRLARDNGISGANMRQRIASRIVTNRRK
jgi:hypothetical protein